MVTENEYAAFVGGQITEKQQTGTGATGFLPVVEVNWYDAFLYALFTHGKLPNEQEWEYAARADPGGTKGSIEYWWSEADESEASVLGRMNQHAWFGGCRKGNALPNSERKIQPVAFVGTIKSKDGSDFAFDSHNPFGVADMLGLVDEWNAELRVHCRNGLSRVIRGGSFDGTSLRYCTCSIRYIHNPGIANLQRWVSCCQGSQENLRSLILYPFPASAASAKIL